MSTLHKSQRIDWVLALVFFAANTLTGYAQSPEINELMVEVWPEYDRPESLVIYRVELDPELALPAQLTFQLPGYIENMHAVAVENNGSLFSVEEEAVELNHQDDVLLLTFPTTTPVVYFEYYDPQILTKQNQDRQLDFSFFAPYNIETAILQVQEPFESTNFQLDPPPSSNFTNDNGLRYQVLTLTNMAPGDTIELSATYQRGTDLPSVQLAGSNVTEHAETASPAVSVITEAEVSANGNFNTGYILIGAGVLLLLGVGVYWWFSNRKQTASPQPRQAASKKRPAARTDEKATIVNETSAGFCYKCGTPLRPESNFCHNCGAERRWD